ncbi:hypothetical protein ACWGID_02100 [Kribbella sp. NPDC054772]
MVESSASRRELLDTLVAQISRETAGSAGLTPEDRALAGQRMQKAIKDAVGQARVDVAALASDHPEGPAADRFVDYLDNTYREQDAQDQARPAGETSAARRMAAEIVASDDAMNRYAPELKRRAEFYIAHAATVAAEAQVRKSPGGPSQAPAAAAGPASAPVVAAASGSTSPARRGPAIG